jgi:putative hemolysin
MVWLGLLLLLICSGIASGSETALFALNRATLVQFRVARMPLKREVYRLMLHPRRVLMTVLITNTGVNLAIFSLSFIAIQRLEHRSPALAAAGGLLALLAVVIFGEILPKALALAAARSVSPFCAAVIGSLELILGPVQWLLASFLVNPLTRLLAPIPQDDAVTPEELRLLVQHSARQGLITSKENEMLQAVVALGDASVREVMTPRVDIKAVAIADAQETLVETARNAGKRRLPVYGRDLDDIKGMIDRRELLLKPDAPIKSLIRPVHYVPEQTRLVQLIRHFRDQGIGWAIVVDEYGGTTGLVSIVDVLSRLVGQLGEEEAPEPEQVTEQVDDNTYLLPGNLSVRVWADRFGVARINRRIDTLGGLIVARLGRFPSKGDSIRILNLTLTVDSVRHRRVERVLLRRDERPAPRGEVIP